MEVVNTNKLYYQCLIAMGNILYSTISTVESKQRAAPNRKYYDQILSDIDIEAVLICKLTYYNAYYQRKVDSSQ